MIRIRKHIAFLLVGIFCFPIIFQSIHIVRHQSHVHKHDHHLCETDTSNSIYFTLSTDTPHQKNKCLICEYHFAINDLPKVSDFHTTIPETNFSFNEIANQVYQKQNLSKKSPRGPPEHIL